MARKPPPEGYEYDPTNWALLRKQASLAPPSAAKAIFPNLPEKEIPPLTEGNEVKGR
jgi:hypothetical protein